MSKEIWTPPLYGWDSRIALVGDGDGVDRIRRVEGGAGTAYAVSSTSIGLAKEITKGTPAAPAFWFKVKAPKYKPDLTMIEDDTLQGSMVKVYDTIPGLRYDSHGWDSFLYMDVVPLLMMGELGSTDTTTVAPTSTTLAASATAGSTSLTVATPFPATGTFIVIDTGANLETAYVKVGGAATLTLQFPLNYAHTNGATVTGLTGHKIGLLNNAASGGNQPPAMTITDFDGEEWRQLAASQIDKLTLKGNASGLADYSSTWFGNSSITPTTPSSGFTTLQAAPGWTAMLQIGATPQKYIVDWEIDLARSVKPIPALTGTQAYFAYFADALTSPGKVTVLEQSGSPELAAYEAGTTETVDIMIYERITGNAMYLHSSKARFKTGEVDRSKAWVEVPLAIDLLPTSTDAVAGGVSPIVAMFGNGQSTAY